MFSPHLFYSLGFLLIIISSIVITIIPVFAQHQQQSRSSSSSASNNIETPRAFHQHAITDDETGQVYFVPSANHTFLMPSLHHINSDMYFNGLMRDNASSSSAPDVFASEDRMRLVFNGFRPVIVFVHVPYNPALADGQLYMEVEELARRIGSFVAMKALNAAENSKMALKGFNTQGIPSFKFYKQGAIKRMETFRFPKSTSPSPGKPLLTANELEDHFLKLAISRKNISNTVVFDEEFNNPFETEEDFYDEIDEHLNDARYNSVMFFEKIYKKSDKGVIENKFHENQNENSEKKNINHHAVEDEDDDEEVEISGDDDDDKANEENRKTPKDETTRLNRRQERRVKILNQLASRVSKNYVIVLKIQYPAVPSTTFMFAQTEAIDRKIRRLEAWFLTLAATGSADNNIAFALIKEKMPSGANSFDDPKMDFGIISNDNNNHHRQKNGEYHKYSLYDIRESIRVVLYRHYGVANDVKIDPDESARLQMYRAGSPFYAENGGDAPKQHQKLQQVVYSIADFTSSRMTIPYPAGVTGFEDALLLLTALLTPPLAPPVKTGIDTKNSKKERITEGEFRGIKYRPVQDSFSTLRGCMEQMAKFSGKYYNDTKTGRKTSGFNIYRDLPEPCVVRGTKEFKSTTLEELIRLYNSSDAEKFMLNGMKPTFEYEERSVKDVLNRWLRHTNNKKHSARQQQEEEKNKNSNDDVYRDDESQVVVEEPFSLNIFQSHVIQELFPYKLPKEFEEFAVTVEENLKIKQSDGTLAEYVARYYRNHINNSVDEIVNFTKSDPYRHFHDGRRHRNCLLRLSPQFSFAGAYTALHADPAEAGGGYMHLWQGRKIWEFVHPKHLVVAKSSIEVMGERNLDYPEQFFFSTSELRRSDNVDPDDTDEENSRREILYVEAGPGDTVMFPPGWLHRVWSLEDAIGVVGYTLLRGWEGSRRYAVEQEVRHLRFQQDFRLKKYGFGYGGK